MPENKTSKQFWLGLLPWLLVAAVLRFWQLEHLPFTNDELSALSRLGHNTFSALLREGVVPDAHPALTQMGLWCYTSLFGETPWVVRFPFIMASLAALTISYRISWSIYGIHTANLCGAMLAAAQPMVYFSVVARPYAIGMLLMAALVYVWHHIVWRARPSMLAHLSLATLISLCVYNHYFNGVMAIVVWFSGWLFWRRLHIKFYILSAVLAFLLFLPHLGITLEQIGRKGIGTWLQAPSYDFLLEWLLSHFNYGIFLPLLLAAFAAWHFVGRLRMKLGSASPFSGAAYVWIGWLLIVYAFSHIYSTVVDPLLHHGTLLFAAPFFFMGLAALSQPRHPLLAKLLPYVVLVVLTYHLSEKRNHYEVMRMQSYGTIAETLSGDTSPQWAVIRQNRVFMKRYFDLKPHTTHELINIADSVADLSSLLNHIAANRPESIYLDGLEPQLIRQLQHHYHTEMLHDGYTFTGFLLTKGKNTNAVYTTLAADTSSILNFDGEYLPFFSGNLDPDSFSFADHAAATLRYSLHDTLTAEHLHVVCELRRGEESLHWSSAHSSKVAMKWDNTYFLSHQVLLWDIFLNRSEMNDVTLSIYLWNPSRATISIQGWEVARMQGGHNRYGLLYRRP